MLSSHWYIQLFGGLTARRGEHCVTRFTTAKTAALLAYLALFPRRAHPRDELADLFWPDAAPDAGRTCLRQALSSLRRQLEPPGVLAGTILITDRANVRINSSAIQTDVARFETCLAATRRAATAAERLSFLNEAIELYAGDLLPGFYDDWAVQEQQRLAATVEQVRAEQALLLASSTDTIAASPTQTATPKNQTRLPMQFTRFFGREVEMAQALRWLAESDIRLVTLTGVGGTGKTRLAVEAGYRLASDSNRMVCFVPLAAAKEPNTIPEAILGALGVAPAGAAAPLEQAISVLSGSRPLLILDNLEQFGEGAAPLLLALLTRVPELSLLATSRHRLFLPGEREMYLSPLPTPPIDESTLIPEQLLQFSGVALFVDRAQLARPDFGLTARNAPAVTAICRRLEGLPLAIELAAARAQSLTPSQMLAQLTERLDQLTSRQKDVGDRHHTLWATIRWSYDLLPPDLPLFWAQLSVFRGGWTETAAQQVCAQDRAADLLAQLRARSLALIEDSGDEMRYRLLESLREFAWEQLTPDGRHDAGQRHAGFFKSLVDRIKPWLRGPELVHGLTLLDAELENIRAGLTWLLHQETGDAALQMALSLTRYWELRGRLREGREWLTSALTASSCTEMTPLRADALCQVAFLTRRLGFADEALAQTLSCLAFYREQRLETGIAAALRNLMGLAEERGDFQEAWKLGQESLTLSRRGGERWIIALILNNLGLVATHLGQTEDAFALHEESLALRREIGDPSAIGMSLTNLGVIADNQQDYERARAFYEQALTLHRTSGFKRDLAIVLNNLANTAFMMGDDTACDAYRDESLAIFDEIGDRLSVTVITYNRAEACRRRGNFKTAISLYRRSLDLAQAVGNPLHAAASMQGLAYVAVAQHHYARAARLLGAVGAYRSATGAAMKVDYRPDYDAHLSQLISALGDAAFTAAWNAGEQMTTEAVLALARSDKLS